MNTRDVEIELQIRKEENMNRDITEALVNITQIFEERLEDFAYKYDAVKAKEFEDIHYFEPILEQWVPLIAVEVKQNGDNLSDYLEFIKPRFHDIIKKEVEFYEKNQELRVLKESEIIENAFMEVLLKYNTNPKMQEEEINNFMTNHKSFYEDTALTFPQMYFQIVANIRSPRIQYSIINSKNTRTALSNYLNRLSKTDFDKLLKAHFMYPLEIELDIYYKKWIGKNKVHVKFCKNILGSKYDYAKKTIKLMEKGKWNPSEEDEDLFEKL